METTTGKRVKTGGRQKRKRRSPPPTKSTKPTSPKTEKVNHIYFDHANRQHKI